MLSAFFNYLKAIFLADLQKSALYAVVFLVTLAIQPFAGVMFAVGVLAGHYQHFKY